MNGRYLKTNLVPIKCSSDVFDHNEWIKYTAIDGDRASCFQETRLPLQSKPYEGP